MRKSWSKISISDYIFILDEYKNGITKEKLAEKYNRSIHTINYIINHYKTKENFLKIGNEKSFTFEQFRYAIAQSVNWKEVAKHLDLSVRGTYKSSTVRWAKMADELKIDYSHFKLIPKTKITNKDDYLNYLKNLKKRGSGHLIIPRLVDLKLLEHKCIKCGLGKTWNGEPITLQLDHINGDGNDNRFENLRILCPNCHSQTETYGGKSQSLFLSKSSSYKCKNCQNPLAERSKSKKNKTGLCTNCIPQKQPWTQWMTDEELEKLVWLKPRTSIAQELGVSDKAVAKRCNSRGIKQPERGYWTKKKHEKSK